MKLHYVLSPFLVLVDCSRVATFLFQHHRRRLGCTRMRSTSKIVLEIEQKFAINDECSHVETRLTELGFSKTTEIKMVDWYFDTPDWSLTPRDCWLRYRETPRGSSWQLKKRGKKHEGGATVYEELKDEEAIEASITLLSSSISDVSVREEYDGHAVPKFPHPTPSPFVPFARIETNRQSWTFDGESEAYDGLSVDLDGTQYGYMVGEVEAVVNNDGDVSLAKTRIDALVKEITQDQDASNHVPVGKLEYYLIRNRPDHYKACVQGGSIQDKSLL